MDNQMPIWRCGRCGYLCAKDAPPPICLICKGEREDFEPFDLGKSSA